MRHYLSRRLPPVAEHHTKKVFVEIASQIAEMAFPRPFYFFPFLIPYIYSTNVFTMYTLEIDSCKTQKVYSNEKVNQDITTYSWKQQSE